MSTTEKSTVRREFRASDAELLAGAMAACEAGNLMIKEGLEKCRIGREQNRGKELTSRELKAVAERVLAMLEPFRNVGRNPVRYGSKESKNVSMTICRAEAVMDLAIVETELAKIFLLP